MNAVHEPTQDEIDAALEREIETARLAMVRADAAGDKDGAREFKETMYAFIARRSRQQIERMSRERGLPV
jgi:hypothetical protein